MSLFTLVSARSQAPPHSPRQRRNPFLGVEPLSGDHSILLPPCLSAVLDWDGMMETSIQSEGGLLLGVLGSIPSIKKEEHITRCGTQIMRM